MLDFFLQTTTMIQTYLFLDEVLNRLSVGALPLPRDIGKCTFASKKNNEKFAIKVLLHHYFQKKSAHGAFTKICVVEGENVVSYGTAKRWYLRFKDGDTSLEGDPPSDRTSTVDMAALRQAVEAAKHHKL